MGLLDIAIIGLILISVLVGLIRGFTKELMSITAWVVSIYLAFNFYEPPAEYFSQFINNELAANIAGGAAIFIVALFVLSMVGYLISKAVSASGVKGTDRVLGAVLGAVRGVLIIGFLVVIASIFNVENRQVWKDSQLISHFEPVASTINSVLPEQFKVTKISGAVDSAAQIQSIISAEKDTSNLEPSDEIIKPSADESSKN